MNLRGKQRRLFDQRDLIDQATRSALSARITVELLGPVPFKGKATAVDVFSVDLGQKL